MKGTEITALTQEEGHVRSVHSPPKHGVLELRKWTMNMTLAIVIIICGVHLKLHGSLWVMAGKVFEWIGCCLSASTKGFYYRHSV